MIRRVAALLSLSLLIAVPAVAQNTQGLPTTAKKDPDKEARLRFQGAQAALYSALAHAEALVQLAEESGDLDEDLGLAHVKVVTRDINECKTDLEKMVTAVPKLNKEDSLKSLNAELEAGLKGSEKAHQAVDGHGKLSDPSKDVSGHLRKALALMTTLADPVGAKTLDVPSPEEASH